MRLLRLALHTVPGVLISTRIKRARRRLPKHFEELGRGYQKSNRTLGSLKLTGR